MELREQCQHRWSDILMRFGLPEKLLNKQNQPCIFCGGKDRARFTDLNGYGYYICSGCKPDGIDGIELLSLYTGLEFSELAKQIRGVLGHTQARPSTGQDVDKVKKRLGAIWKASHKISPDGPVAKYLRNRGLTRVDLDSLQDIREHDSLTYWTVEDGQKPVKVGEYPAMVAMVSTPEGENATLHITYLTPDGEKAPLDPSRKVMPPARKWQGGAIRLGSLDDGKTLCVAEGIETALTMLNNNPDLCVWACISAGNMSKFVPPDDFTSTVYVAADNDLSFTGQAAAFEAARRLTQLGKCKVSVLMPEQAGTDWNDVLLAGGLLLPGGFV